MAMKVQAETYHFFLLMNVVEILVNGQYYSKCEQPEVTTFIKDPMFTNSCDSVLYGSIMCNSIRGCDMFKMTGNTCIYYRSNTGCNEIGIHNTRMFKKLACQAGWSLKGNRCYIQTTQTVTCNDVQTSCQDLGGIAAEFHSTEEMNDALAVITSNVYVGGSLQLGGFLWDGSQQQIDSALWLPNEPVGGDCVQIWKDINGLDALNRWFYNSVLCEQKMSTDNRHSYYNYQCPSSYRVELDSFETYFTQEFPEKMKTKLAFKERLKIQQRYSNSQVKKKP